MTNEGKMRKYISLIGTASLMFISSMFAGCVSSDNHNQLYKLQKPVAAYRINYNAGTHLLSMNSINVTPPSAGQNITGKAGVFQTGSAVFNGSMVTATVYIVNNDTAPWTGVEMQAYTIMSGSPTAADTDLGTGWFTNSPAYGAWGWIFTSGTAGSTYTIPAGGRSANKVIGFYATSNFAAWVYVYANVPVITGITPPNGSGGSTVTISGYNFLSTQGSVTFKGISATVQTWANTSIVTTVPTNVTSGNVEVNTVDPNIPYSNPYVFPHITPAPPTILTATAGNNEVTLTWSPSTGTPIGTYAVGNGPWGIAIDASGNVWVVNDTSNTVTKLSAAGSIIGTYPVGNSPAGIVIDNSSGNVWVTNYNGNNVTKLSSTGSTLGTYAVGTNPYSVAIDSSGNVWVANDTSNNVTELNSAGSTIGTYAVGSNPYDIVIDPSGNIWVTNQWGSPSVTKLSPAGSTIGSYGVGSIPYGIAVDNSGNAWVANAGSNNVTELSPTGSTIGTYAVGNTPRSITIDNAGDAWVTNAGDNTVTELNPNGTTLGTYAVGNYPMGGIAIDSSGNVWITNYNGNNVTELTGARSYNVFYTTNPVNGPWIKTGFTTTTS